MNQNKSPINSRDKNNGGQCSKYFQNNKINEGKKQIKAGNKMG